LLQERLASHVSAASSLKVEWEEASRKSEDRWKTIQLLQEKLAASEEQLHQCKRLQKEQCDNSAVDAQERLVLAQEKASLAARVQELEAACDLSVQQIAQLREALYLAHVG
jgi:uncharacterized protein YciW